MWKKLSRKGWISLSGEHYVGNMIDHHLKEINLSDEEKTIGYKYLRRINPDLLLILMCYCTSSALFKSYLYKKSLRFMSPTTWGYSVRFDVLNTCFDWEYLKDLWLTLCNQVLSAIVNTASVERVFLTFSLTQSRLLNRLENEKNWKINICLWLDWLEWLDLEGRKYWRNRRNSVIIINL